MALLMAEITLNAQTNKVPAALPIPIPAPSLSLPKIAKQGTNLVINFPVKTGDFGAVYVLQYSFDLFTWTDIEGSKKGLGPTKVVFTQALYLAPNSSQQAYFRLREIVK